MDLKSLKTYYYLTKPGIIRGNLISAAAGFLLASKGDVDVILLVFTLLGIALIIASGCVFNNYIDRELDKKMERTKNRAIVTGEISGKSAIVFASLLGILGLLVLGFFTNLLTTFIGILGLFFYVVVYGYWKRKSDYGTLVGSISGALPPVAGYVSVTNSIDLVAILLFLILALWQMPHFYAIAIFRSKEYDAASLPVLSLTRGNETTKKHILIYIVAFTAVALSFSIFGYTGLTYAIVLLAVCGWWFAVGLSGRKANDDTKWARKVFGSSLVVLLIFSVMISINSFVP